MRSDRRSLRQQYPRHQGVPFLLGVAILALPFALLLPTLTLSQAGGLSKSTFSIATGVVDLARRGSLSLALIIFTFSFAFPLVKVAALSFVWFRRMRPATRERLLQTLRVLGKWSMLDVFVVAVFVGAVRFGFLASATPRFGIYLFSGVVLLSMLITYLELRLARGSAEQAPANAAPSLAALPVAILSFLFLAAGLELPLMEVRKWLFWNREYSVLTATRAMAKDGHYLIAGIVATFVVALPLAKLAGQIGHLFVRRPTARRRGRLVAFFELLDKWAMIDVFALGMLIVVVKIGSVADVSPRLGLACFFAGVFLSASTSWLMKS